MKRCPRCGRTYDDIWQVCLEDGEPIIDCGSIPHSPEVEELKSKAQDEESRKKTSELKTLFRMSLFFAVIALFVVYKTSGSPFENSFASGGDRIKIMMYNAGTIAGMLMAGFVVSLPVWMIWKKMK